MAISLPGARVVISDTFFTHRTYWVPSQACSANDSDGAVPTFCEPEAVG
jgi:hypothetical protein